MSETNTGGPAFPIERQTIAEQYGSVGMTLRDYFAAKAMQTLLEQNKSVSYSLLCAAAYDIADAMLKARDQS